MKSIIRKLVNWAYGFDLSTLQRKHAGIAVNDETLELKPRKCPEPQS